MINWRTLSAPPNSNSQNDVKRKEFTQMFSLEMKWLRWFTTNYIDTNYFILENMLNTRVLSPFLYKTPEVSVLVGCSAFSESHCSKVLNLFVRFVGSGPSPSTFPTFNFS